MLQLFCTSPISELSEEPAYEYVGRVIVVCGIYLGLGASWMCAGWFYWSKRYLLGIVSTAVGALIPIVLLAVLWALFEGTRI